MDLLNRPPQITESTIEVVNRIRRHVHVVSFVSLSAIALFIGAIWIEFAYMKNSRVRLLEVALLSAIALTPVIVLYGVLRGSSLRRRMLVARAAELGLSLDLEPTEFIRNSCWQPIADHISGSPRDIVWTMSGTREGREVRSFEALLLHRGHFSLHLAGGAVRIDDCPSLVLKRRPEARTLLNNTRDTPKHLAFDFHWEVLTEDLQAARRWIRPELKALLAGESFLELLVFQQGWLTVVCTLTQPAVWVLPAARPDARELVRPLLRTERLLRLLPNEPLNLNRTRPH